MEYIATREEMQAIDAYSIDVVGIPGMVLMEKAAMALFEEIAKHISRHSRCLIVVEKGNNGGDGLALARLLSEAGYQAEVYEIGGIKKASVSYQAQRAILAALGIRVYGQMPAGQYDVVVDGIFGVGLTREVKGIHKEVIEALNQKEAYRIAIDIPSGVDATTGQVLGAGFRADLTVTFGLGKVGLLLYPGASYAGEVAVKEIGFPKIACDKVSPGAFTIGEKDLALLPERMPDSNKGTYGKVLVVAGSKNMAGAAYLCGKAAYKSGSGLVRIFTHESNRVILQAKLPEAILTTYENEGEAGEKLKDAIKWASVIVCGPGLGTGGLTRSFLHIIKEYAKVSIILDADGLNEISNMNREGEDYFSGFGVPVILTPHMLEMSRLSGYPVEKLKAGRTALAQKYAAKNGVVLALKDSRTVVADGRPGSLGKLYINRNGNSGMATGGSGDVLAGMMAGILAGGADSFRAAFLAVYLHGFAGDLAGQKVGRRSLMAGDIVEYIGEAFGDR